MSWFSRVLTLVSVVLLGLGGSIFFCSILCSQDVSEKGKSVKKGAPVVAPANLAPVEELGRVVDESVGDSRVVQNGSCFLLICDSDPKLVIVLDGGGKWVSDVRSVRFESDLLNNVSVSCSIYGGPFKPSNPKVVSWGVSQVKSVSRDEFLRVVDELQVNPVYQQR